MADTDTSTSPLQPLLRDAVADLTSLLFSLPSALSSLDGVVQEHLGRNDEILALVDSARAEVQQVTDVSLTSLLAQTRVSAGLGLLAQRLWQGRRRGPPASSLAQPRPPSPVRCLGLTLPLPPC